jgi:hypothetical protein
VPPAEARSALVLALPRGGVPVGLEVATALGAPLDVFLVRKLGVPGHRELAMGALASGGVRVLNPAVVDALGLPGAVLDAVAAREQAELERRERAYRGVRPTRRLAAGVSGSVGGPLRARPRQRQARRVSGAPGDAPDGARPVGRDCAGAGQGRAAALQRAAPPGAPCLTGAAQQPELAQRGRPPQPPVPRRVDGRARHRSSPPRRGAATPWRPAPGRTPAPSGGQEMLSMMDPTRRTTHAPVADDSLTGLPASRRPSAATGPGGGDGGRRARPVLGGLHHAYERAA